MDNLKEIKHYEICMACYVYLTTTKTDHNENKNPILGWTGFLLVLNFEGRCLKQGIYSGMPSSGLSSKYFEKVVKSTQAFYPQMITCVDI
jgi:hypothetical protein